MGPVRVKVCCIRDVEEARMAVEAGASALGLVSEMPSGPGVIDEETIAAVAAAAPPAVATFLLTCLPDAARIADQVRRTHVSTVQICDRPQPGTAAALRRALPALKIVQVVHVTGPASVDEAPRGGSGRGRDPARLRQPGARASRSWAARAAATTGRSARRSWPARRAPSSWPAGSRPRTRWRRSTPCSPWGLDICSGVRTDGRLDAEKLARLFAAVHSLPPGTRAGSDRAVRLR